MKRVMGVCIVGSCITTLVACGTTAKKLDVGTETFLSKPVELKLKGADGRLEINRYYSDSNIRAYEKDQIVREKEEIVEFTTESKFAKTKNPNQVSFAIKTVKKDGPVGLHDLGFPEKSETIDFVTTPNGEIIKAGEYPKDSLFFIPSMPLPKTPVSKGDTWTMKHQWVSTGNNLPLEVEIVSILKRFFECGKAGICADIEISGNVAAPAVQKAGISFTSEIRGQMIFSVNEGTLVWSDVKSKEEMKTPEGRIQVSSCLGSKLMEPVTWDFKKANEECKPMAF